MVGATVPESPVEGKYCLHVVVPAAGANNWDIGMTDGSHTFQKGKKYTFCLLHEDQVGHPADSPEAGTRGRSVGGYNELVLTVTDKWQEFYATTPVMAADVTPASPTFHFAFATGDFWMDGIRLYEGDYVKPTFLKSFVGGRAQPQGGRRGRAARYGPELESGPRTPRRTTCTSAPRFADVNTADVGARLVSKGQADTTFKPADAAGIRQDLLLARG